MERFYREDKAEWDDNLKTIKKEANKNRDQIEDLINKYSLELQALLSQNNTLELPTPGQEDKFTLRKLPFWGKEPSKSERNKFEWPTRDALDKMQADVHVKSITFKEHVDYYGLASVQFHMTDGTQSPLIQTRKGTKFFQAKTINL